MTGRRRPASFVPTPPRHIAGVGAALDPAAEAAIAAVDWRQERPVLLGVWSIYGSTLSTWNARACAGAALAAEAVLQVGGALELVHSLAERPVPVRVRRGGARGVGGDKQGLATADYVGRYRGLGMAAMTQAGFPMPAEVLQPDWVLALSVPLVVQLGALVAQKKRGEGLHRITEASRLVEGAEEALLAIPLANRKTGAAKRRVDGAEAILQACAAVRLGGPRG